MLKIFLPRFSKNPTSSFPILRGSIEAFAVVRTAMLQADKVAIGEVAFGGREHLIAIAPAPEKTRAA